MVNKLCKKVSVTSPVVPILDKVKTSVDPEIEAAEAGSIIRRHRDLQVEWSW